MSCFKSNIVRRYFFKFVLFISIFYTFSISAVAQVKEVEPNNTFQTADTINILSDKSGTVQVSVDENDYFKTFLPDDGTLKIYVQGTNNGTSSTRLGIYVYDKSRQQLRVRDVSGSAIAPGATAYDTITLYGVAKDTFYFRLQAFGTLSYRLKYNILDVTPNDVEPNNTFTQALPINQYEIKAGHVGYTKTCISGGIGCSYVGTDTDYYRAVINTFGTVKINIKAKDVYGDPSVNTSSQLSLFVYDRRKGNGLLLTQNVNTADGTTVLDTAVLNCQGPDTLYFRIYSQSAYGYELSYSTGDTSTVNDEPNNSFPTATRIALNDTIKTNIGYQTLSVTDNLDYYSTLLPSKGTVRVYVQAKNTSGGAGWLYTNIYDRRRASGLLLSKYIANSSSIPAGNTLYDTININCVNTDTLFLNWQSSGCFKYSFRVEHTNRAPSANFEFTKTGNLYEFTNTSLNASTYKWDFGNGTISTIPNPPLKSFVPGFYAVKLIANNTTGCNYADTIIKSITVKGIERYTPVTGGNGNLLFTIYGGGFNSNTILKLRRGSTVYTDSGRSVNRYGNIYTSIMDMHNAAIGLYDVDIITTDSTYHYPNGFQLQQYKDSLQINLIGREIVRAQDSNLYKFRILNKGNTIAGATEVFILLPSSIQITSLDGMITTQLYTHVNPDTISEVIPVTVNDGFPVSGNLRGYIINGIPPGGYRDLSFILNIPLGNQPIYIWVRGPYNGSNERSWAENCWKARLELGLNFINFGLDLITFVDCAWNITKLVWSTGYNVYEVATGGLDKFMNQVTMASYGKTMTSTVMNCSGEAGLLLSPAAAIVIERASMRYDFAVNGKAIYDVYKDLKSKCDLEARDKYQSFVKSLSSIDPNSINGPTGFKLNRYINRNKKSINYTVFFENLQTATLPAQKVVILDTLDNNVFDLKTLKILSFGVGRKSYTVPMENKEFVTDVTIDSNLFVRLNIKMDTLTGILKANFKTIDRTTGIATTNPLSGFLPPNIHTPEGQGHFTFSIELKNSISHGAVINNKASIIFDNNNPILTNLWSNTIDTIRPISTIVSLTRLNDSTARIISNGTDAHSGVESYRLYGSKNGSPFEWLGNISDTAVFYGQKDTAYAFYILAVDSVGNIESKAPVAEAVINFGVLPVTMLPLKATKESIGNRLNWTTVTEQHNKGFFIEKSEDGRIFNYISFIPSNSVNGNSTDRLNYSYIDISAGPKTYYRLKQIDKDGRFTYSNTVFIDRGKALNVSVYPIPAKDELLISSDRRLTNILITDLSGKIVKRLLPTTTNRYFLEDIQSGVYILELVSGQHREQVKIIIVK